MDFRDVVEDVLDEFDFDKVHRVMDLLDWKWASSIINEEGNGVPSKSALRKHARESLMDAAKRAYKEEEPYSSFSGGFLVRAEWDSRTSKIYLRLSFEVESWDNYD